MPNFDSFSSSFYTLTIHTIQTTTHVDFSMHSAHPICKNEAHFSSFFLLLILSPLIIQASYGVTNAATATAAAATRLKHMKQSEAYAPTHTSFFRATLRGRQRVLSCANDPNVCLDRDKNPWGGDVCCFRKSCKDLSNDLNNCGSCGNVCGYGNVCCDGKCVDVQNDPQHCGSCFEECPGENRCVYSMCDYGG